MTSSNPHYLPIPSHWGGGGSTYELGGGDTNIQSIMAGIANKKNIPPSQSHVVAVMSKWDMYIKTQHCKQRMDSSGFVS